jgi:hypothetical protein
VGLRHGDLEEGDDDDWDDVWTVEKAGNWFVRWERRFFGEHAGMSWTMKNGSWFVRRESWFLGERAGSVGSSSDCNFPLHPLCSGAGVGTIVALSLVQEEL